MSVQKKINIWVSPRIASFPDEPAGTVGKVVNASSTEERKNTTNLPVGNLDPKEDQTRH